MSRLTTSILVFVALFIVPKISVEANLWCGDKVVSAEWLYMLDSVDQSYFVVVGNPDAFFPNGKRPSNSQEWHSGYRLEIGSSLCDCLNDIALRWTHFPSFSDSKSVSGDNLFTIVNPIIVDVFSEPGTAAIRDKFELYYLDLFLNRKVIDCFPFILRLKGGLQYGHLRFREKIEYPGLDIPRMIKYASRFWGVGPELGINFSCHLCQGLSLAGRGEAALLISDREASFFDNSGIEDPDAAVDVVAESYWKVVPFANVRFGLNYSCCLGCVDLRGEIGYEVIALFNGIERIVAIDLFGANFDERVTFTLNGLYLHLGVRF